MPSVQHRLKNEFLQPLPVLNFVLQPADKSDNIMIFKLPYTKWMYLTTQKLFISSITNWLKYTGSNLKPAAATAHPVIYSNHALGVQHSCSEFMNANLVRWNVNIKKVEISIHHPSYMVHHQTLIKPKNLFLQGVLITFFRKKSYSDDSNKKASIDEHIYIYRSSQYYTIPSLTR